MTGASFSELARGQDGTNVATIDRIATDRQQRIAMLNAFHRERNANTNQFWGAVPRSKRGCDRRDVRSDQRWWGMGCAAYQNKCIMVPMINRLRITILQLALTAVAYWSATITLSSIMSTNSIRNALPALLYSQRVSSSSSEDVECRPQTPSPSRPVRKCLISSQNGTFSVRPQNRRIALVQQSVQWHAVPWCIQSSMHNHYRCRGQYWASGSLATHSAIAITSK